MLLICIGSKYYFNCYANLSNGDGTKEKRKVPKNRPVPRP